ncbi:MAG: CDP-alcohol phosphatidyltransferase family protein [Acidimicrobiales bacterium]
MLDRQLRARANPAIDRISAVLANAGVRPGLLTAVGWLGGVGCVVSVATHHWNYALGLWIFNRALDALDGAVARQRGATDLGGYLDLIADFSIYGGFLVAIGLTEPTTRIACLVLFLMYYLSGTAFLTLSALIEKRQRLRHDERSIEFVGGLAEGFETALVYAAITIFPNDARWILWAFTVAVGVTVVQRIAFARAVLHQPAEKKRSHRQRPIATKGHATTLDALGCVVPSQSPPIARSPFPSGLTGHAEADPRS